MLFIINKNPNYLFINLYFSNKNDDDDDDAQDEVENCTMDHKDLCLSKIILEIKSRDSSMLYECPTEEMQYSI